MEAGLETGLEAGEGPWEVPPGVFIAYTADPVQPRHGRGDCQTMRENGFTPNGTTCSETAGSASGGVTGNEPDIKVIAGGTPRPTRLNDVCIRKRVVPPMAENTPQQQQVQLRIDESKMHSTYANTIRTSTTPEEVVLDFGINMPMPSPEGQPTMIFAVGSRVVMNWAGIKRLAINLGQVVRQYEERNGEIQLNRGQGGQGGAGGPRLAN